MDNNRKDEEGKGKVIRESREGDKDKKWKTKGKELGEKSTLKWRGRNVETKGELNSKGEK
jgi:hypothetical protein